MTYNLNISNVDDNILEVIKSLLKIAPNSSMRIEKNDYSFDDLNDETKKVILDNMNVSKSFHSVDELMKDLNN